VSRIRLLPFAIAFVAMFMPIEVSASIQTGLRATVYDNYTGQYNQFNSAPPLPPTTPICLETSYPNLYVDFDASPVCNIWDDFVVKFEGYITAPSTGTYTFYMHGDDGTRLYFDGQMVENFWRDTGNGGQTFTYSMTAGQSVALLAWYYENGGGAWVRLEYLENGSWIPVPESWFTQDVVQTTTTTVAPYLNSPQNLTVTSTNESKVYLSWDIPEASNISVERYAVFFSCDNWDTSYAIPSIQTTAVVENLNSGTECQFKIRADNDTMAVYSAFTESISGTTQTTTTTTTTTTTEPETTTTEPETTTTEPGTTTTESTTTEPEPETTTTTEPEPTAQNEQPDNGTTTSTSEPDPLPQAQEDQETPDTTSTSIDLPLNETTEEAESVTSEAVNDVTAESTVPEITIENIEDLDVSSLSESELTEVLDEILSQPLSNEEFSNLIDVLSDESVSEEQIVDAVDQIIENGITADQAAEIATSPEVLAAVSGEQAAEIFDQIAVSELTPDQAEQIIAAVQEASEEVRDAFEEQINVYGGQFDTYTPVGSKVDVKTRRVVVAAGAALFAAPAMTPPSQQPPSSGPGGTNNPSGGNSGGSGEPKDSGEKRSRRARRIR
jgi:biopolymer transport protein ExbD